MKFAWVILIFIFPRLLPAQVILTGYVKDQTGRSLPAVNIRIANQNLFSATDTTGKFSMLVKPGPVQLILTHTGYQKISEKFILRKDTTFNFTLNARVEELNEVVISSKRFHQADQLQTTRMSSITLGRDDVNSIPMLGGEADLMKMIQLLPGVIRGVEGGTDLFVRGGAADQNLVLLDGAPIYNTGHLLGFMSVFNSDVLESVESMTGAFPAEYGGRLSSILDVKTRSGFADKTRIQGNIGLLASRLLIEQPLIKNKLSISLAGRRTYLDQVGKLAHLDLPYYFYDVNAKVNYKLRGRDQLEFSYYTGKDVLAYSNPDNKRDTSRRRNFTSNFGIGNNAQILKWKKFMPHGWRSDLSLLHTRFNYTISSVFDDNSLFVTSKIEDVGAKWIVSSDSAFGFSVKGGIESVHHRVSPNVINTTGTLSELLKSSSTLGLSLVESSIFGQIDKNFTTRWRASLGMRVSSGLVQHKFYVNPEPRLAIRYAVSPQTTLKASYSRMAQYLQRVSSAAVAFPTDIWYPITKDVLPQISNQVSVAFQHNFSKANVFLSVESYYKKMDHLIGYREGTNLFLNTHFEEQLIQGKGRAYGIEVLLKKDVGKFSGWISYTLSRSQRQYDEVNQGQWFLAKYDRRHNVAVVTSYRINSRWSVSAVWEFMSGSRFTPVIGQYVVPAPTLAGIDLIPVYAKMNSVKLADTHRLDLGIKLRSKPNKKFQGEWFAGVYNVYNRASPIGIMIESNGDGSYKYQQPGLFGLLPFVSYGFRF
jgi:TonB dependent receptor/TonB-dependent Receptor Plug Domain/CarboxypepD_reg-like domain